MAHPPIRLRRWSSLTAQEQAQVLALRIDERQVEYAGRVQQAVETCLSSSPHEVAGLAICVGAQVAGFLVLRRGSMLPGWAPCDAVALAGMRIDLAFQGAGVGRQALREVDRWLAAHWPEVPMVALTVDEDNVAGRRAYEAAGYAAFAVPGPGRIGTVHYLAKSLRPAAAHGAAVR